MIWSVAVVCCISVFALAIPELHRHFSAMLFSLHIWATKYASLKCICAVAHSCASNEIRAKHRWQSSFIRCAFKSFAMSRQREKCVYELSKFLDRKSRIAIWPRHKLIDSRSCTHTPMSALKSGNLHCVLRLSRPRTGFRPLLIQICRTYA